MIVGGDFLVRIHGRQLPFRQGDIIAIAGHEIPHATTQWKGDSRFCFVNTTHQSVYRQGNKELGGPSLTADDPVQDTCLIEFFGGCSGQ